eukprot:364949-Chlamydomonas_euryale.AAC.5
MLTLALAFARSWATGMGEACAARRAATARHATGATPSACDATASPVASSNSTNPSSRACWADVWASAQGQTIVGQAASLACLINPCRPRAQLSWEISAPGSAGAERSHGYSKPGALRTSHGH